MTNTVSLALAANGYAMMAWTATEQHTGSRLLPAALGWSLHSRQFATNGLCLPENFVAMTEIQQHLVAFEVSWMASLE